MDSGGSLGQGMEHVPAAFALVRGAEHEIVYVNAAFRRLFHLDGDGRCGVPLAEVLADREAPSLLALLDRAQRSGAVQRDRRIEPLDDGGATWYCTAWPEASEAGPPERLLFELRSATEAEATLGQQRDIAERMLLSALRERGAADAEAASNRRATHLAVEGRRLATSLDEDATIGAMSRLSLPGLAEWCIVDLLDDAGAMHRVAIVHPDPAKQALLTELEGHWRPVADDPFGLPALMRSAAPVVVMAERDDLLAAVAHEPDVARVLGELAIGRLLSVPLVVRERLVGAVTFVGQAGAQPYSRDDIALATDLAARSALALENARLHGEAISLRERAEVASTAKSSFLGTMSHELRTPLNAIAGYVDLIDLGIRGPVTDAQHLDLDRIRRSQRHLLALINDVLNFVRLGSGRALYDLSDVVVHDVLDASIALVEPLMREHNLQLAESQCDAAIRVRADEDRLTQIIVNLLSNAIKFTSAGGRLSLQCVPDGDLVRIHVADTGIGIPRDKFDAIFDPFVQVRGGWAGRDNGAGLGLAISRDLARGMGGELTVESTLEVGSTFTLTLPGVAG